MVEKRRVLRGRGRLLSLSGGGRKISTSEAAASWDDLNLRRRASSGETATSSAAASKGSNRLIDCAFVAGLCVDRFTARNVIFSREVFPQDFNLPNGIEELCFPDSNFWLPHPPEETGTYTLVLTGPDGERTFGYCRRIQPEGDDYCLPLAICILSKFKARGLYSQILEILTSKYGSCGFTSASWFARLHRQTFPSLAARSVEICPELNLKAVRPLDARMDGAALCQLLSTEQILLVYKTAIRERRIVFLSQNLSDLAVTFDGVESLLQPLSWQHSLVPVLPSSRLGFLEAPTPYLIGLLLSPEDAKDLDKWWRTRLNPIVGRDPDCLVIALGGRYSKSKVLKPTKESLSLPKEIAHDLHRRTKAFNKSESETETFNHKSEVKRESRLKQQRRHEQELKEAINKSKFVMFCETLSRGLSRALHSNLADFVTYDKSRGRVFCVQDFVDSFLETDCYDFMFDLAQTAMFGEYMRTCVSLLAMGEASPAAEDSVAAAAEVDNEINRRSRKKKKKKRKKERSKSRGERNNVEEKQVKKEKAPVNYANYHEEYERDDDDESRRKSVFDRVEAISMRNQDEREDGDFVQDVQRALKQELELDLEIERREEDRRQQQQQPNFIV